MAIGNRQTEDIDHNDSLDRKGSRLVIASAIDGHPLDGLPGKGSPFTNSLMRILLENTQKSMSSSELIVHLRKDMFESRKGQRTKQLPSVGILRNTNHEGGEFCFNLRKEYIEEQDDDTRQVNRKRENKDDRLEELLQISLKKLKEEFTKVVETNNDKLEDRMIKLEKSKTKEKTYLNKKELLDLIKKDRIEDFFDKVDEIQEEIDETQIINLINLQSQWRAIENQRRLGIIDFSNESIGKNKLRKSIIEVTNMIKKR